MSSTPSLSCRCTFACPLWQWLTALLMATSLYACTTSPKSSQGQEPLHRLVDPLIGTDWVGNTFPGASAVFGMVQLSPDNGLPGWDRIAGYYYPDSTIAGFSHTHLSGTGAGDLYDVSFMPAIAPLQVDESSPLGLHAYFSHSDEEATAGYYRVRLSPYNIQVELTATERVGVQRYTFDTASDSALIVLDLARALNWDRTTDSYIARWKRGVMGYRYSDGWARDQRVYFYTALSRQPDAMTIDSTAVYDKGGDTPTGYRYKAYMHYRVKAGEQIVITTALSGVDLQGAKSNHETEAPDFDFDGYRERVTRQWDSTLGQITIEGMTRQEQRTFYTALYHAHLCPTLYSDADGRYLGADRRVYQLPKEQRHYSTFSLWDTYRAAHPLYTILSPDKSRDMVQSLVDFGTQNQGYLPVWTMWASETDMMIGYHSVPVIVEAILKGVYKPADPEHLTALLRTTAERSGYRGLDDYRQYGYVPADKHRESLSKTLEYAYDDAAIAAWGRWSGDSTLATQYARRAESYRHLWDKETAFFRPRMSDGRFKTPFDPFAYTEDVTESNAYQYLMSVQHDPEGLVALMGGVDSLASRLDRLFSVDTPRYIELPIFSTGMIGQYVQGNEPGHHIPWLYNIARQPWKTAEITQRICREMYTDRPDGLCGNEDCGQMSAWYVFASMGFYPLDPLSGRYELTTPRSARSTISVGQGGKPFVIEARGLSADKRYIERVEIDGQPWDKSYITHEQIERGAHVVLVMTDQKGVCWY